MSDSSVSAAKKSSKKLWLILLLLCVAAGAGWWWSQNSADSAKQGPRMGGSFMGKVPVNAQQVRLDRFAVQLKALGTVTPWNAVSVTSQVAGELDQVLFTEGQFVEKGTLLAHIDPRSYQAELLQAEGALQETRAQLASAQLDLKRYQGLYKEDSVARQTLEQQQAIVAQYQGTLKVRQAQRDAARLDVQHTRIEAPISGRLGLRALDAGNYVSAGSTELVTITQDNPIAVNFTIPEHELQAVLQAYRQEQPLPVQVWNRDETELLAEGVLDSIDNQVDVSTGSVRLKARFANPEQVLFPNQFVNVRLQVTVHEQALLVPADAIQFGSNGRFVWQIQDDDTVLIQPIEILTSDGTQSMLRSGLEAGDWVVVEGVDRLRSGSKVERVAPAGSEPEPVPTEASVPEQTSRGAAHTAQQKAAQ
ncbi:MAG: efflux RND transporter periplasmic adaptor subunit [Pseudomonas sp.]|nr:efflux RND transporter periplasmic adaptor subunit [Pseudomonas sp.]MDD2222716.1 efflux RND transporter periplasmic adaptor subunit [Pseudomonas sp.]MDY0415265.1 efflux RND transporter periplasmic adaptor subunit [Pseudomonas sp.]NLO52918.1 efflux RND transporter periplasmic adaptor subunit [Gammaproteobacteria bacterium]